MALGTTWPAAPSVHETEQRLKVALALNSLVIATEMIGGLAANSLGLLSDAVHNLIDEATLILTLYAYCTASKPASAIWTLGRYKVEALAGWINAAALGVVTVWLMIEAILRMRHPQVVQPIVMLAVALMASLGNLAVALALRRSASQNLNIKSAYLHNLGDAVISLAPVLGGCLIAATGLKIVDPLIGLGIGTAVLVGTWTIVRDSSRILLDRVPQDIQAARVAEALLAVPGVRNAHDLHITAANPTLRLLTCQLLVDDMHISESRPLLRTIRTMLVQRFGIGHATIQLETSSCHPQVLYCNLRRRHLHQLNAHDGHNQPLEKTWAPAAAADQ